MTLPSQIIPKQLRGAHTGVTSKFTAQTRHEAIVIFNRCKQLLVDVNNWKRICGDKGSQFWLTDNKGQVIKESNAKHGHYIRVELPAPKNHVGDGFDWVYIEAFENTKSLIKDEEIFGFRVRPIQNPANKSHEIAHFYNNGTTSTFLVIRNNDTVKVMERGRNELPNSEGSCFYKIRNRIIALPAMLGFSNPQWKLLTNGILIAATNDRSA